jgi:hypothetical protein
MRAKRASPTGLLNFFDCSDFFIDDMIVSTLSVIAVLSLLVTTTTTTLAQPQVPHYVDGEHNAAFVEHRASLSAHSCAKLLELYGTSYGRRAAVIPENVELERFFFFFFFFFYKLS